MIEALITRFLAPVLGIALAAALAMAGWQFVRAERIQSEFHAYRADAEAAGAAAARQALADFIAMQERKDAAIKNAEARARTHAAAAAGARAERDSLRDELAAARAGLPTASCASVREHAAALNTVFDQCAGALEDLAGKAQGHAADALTLREAWPSTSTELQTEEATP